MSGVEGFYVFNGWPMLFREVTFFEEDSKILYRKWDENSKILHNSADSLAPFPNQKNIYLSSPSFYKKILSVTFSFQMKQAVSNLRTLITKYLLEFPHTQSFQVTYVLRHLDSKVFIVYLRLEFKCLCLVHVFWSDGIVSVDFPLVYVSNTIILT